MRAVIDTNILVMCLSSTSPYHLIYQKLIQQAYEIAVSSEIVLEYCEIISRKYDKHTALLLEELLLELPNVKKSETYFKWNLITEDPDDNKFRDCAISAGVDFIVTEDKHFNILKKIDFPKVRVIGIEDFLKLLEN